MKSHTSPSCLPLGVGRHSNFVTMSSGQHVVSDGQSNGFVMQSEAPPPPAGAGVLQATPLPNGTAKAMTQRIRFLTACWGEHSIADGSEVIE